MRPGPTKGDDLGGRHLRPSAGAERQGEPEGERQTRGQFGFEPSSEQFNISLMPEAGAVALRMEWEHEHWQVEIRR